MLIESKKISNPFSTGGGGTKFETNIQAAFVTLMLTKGHAPCLPCWPIVEIKLQGKIADYSTDDIIVFIQNSQTNERRRLLGQVKHSIYMTNSNLIFGEVIKAAWDDFNNEDVFTKGKDIIALITGPLSESTIKNVNYILEQARHTKDENEFLLHINKANFSSNAARKKLITFQIHLKNANNGVNLSDFELFNFLKHFFLLGYDLDKKGSVVSSLLQSHISQYNKEIPEKIWYQIIDTVQSFNQNAGTITLENLPEELKKEFEKPKIKYIPIELIKTEKVDECSRKTDWNLHSFSSHIALLSLIGSWNENEQHDKDILTQIVGDEYENWIKNLRELLHTTDCPFSFKNGIWSIENRKEYFELFANRIYDNNLDIFKEIILKVLKINDPAFELPLSERYAASIYGKTLPYSKILRESLTHTLALMGNNWHLFVNCSRQKCKMTVQLIVKEIFKDADSILWGSLDRLLPLIAESSPSEFLEAVNNALVTTPCPFEQLYKEEENNTAFGQNYITGLLWALEEIAWEEKYLIQTTVILSELATHDPGGNWANRPINSLTDIFLPWLPHTLSSVSKRQVALKTICVEQPSIGWNLLVKLLPNQHSTTSGTYKPKYRDIFPNDWQKKISKNEYQDQVEFCSNLLIELAEYNILKLSKLAEIADKLSTQSFEIFLKKIVDKECIQLNDIQKKPLWYSFEKLYLKHKRYSNTSWALKENQLSKIKVILELLTPKNPYLIHQNLFTQRDNDLYENSDNWEDESKKLFKKRTLAIKEIMDNGGIEETLKFMKDVNQPFLVGSAAAALNSDKLDILLLPKLLKKENTKEFIFISSYISYKVHTYTIKWFDDIDKSKWNLTQLAFSLCSLPFNKNTWDRVNNLLNKEESKYWLTTDANAHQIDSEFEYPIKKLLKYNRFYDALEAFSTALFKKEEINIELLCKTLILVSTSEKLGNGQLDTYHITELIKYLQNHKLTDIEKLFQIEWVYLNLLTSSSSETRPKTLENKLATDPEFFCELIRLSYKSEGSADEENISDKQRNIATNAYRIMHNWKTIPGIEYNGNFNSELFNHWTTYIENSTRESGHYEIAMTKLGEILVNSPKDSSDLYINKTIAVYLNKKTNKDLRHGYEIGIYNARGAHLIDYNEEIKLAKAYENKAEDVENEGFHRLAMVLRTISDDYYTNSERIKLEY